MLLLSCSAPQPAQELSAQEIFRQIEDRVFGAKTVRVSFKIEGIPASADGKTTVHATGTLLLKEGNKAHLKNTHTLGDERETSEAVSDGRRFQGRNGRLVSRATEVPEYYGSWMRAALSRSSIFISWTESALPQEETRKAGQDLAAKNLFILSNLRTGEDDERRKTLLYSLTLTPPGTRPFEGKLWYDPETYIVVKRTLDSEREGIRVHLVESYDNVEFDVDIPETEFQLLRPGK